MTTNQHPRCYTCGTEDFTEGEFADTYSPAGTYPDADANLYCLACAIKYDNPDIEVFQAIPTFEQVSAWIDWQLAGIGAD